MISDPIDQRHLLSLSGYEIINLLQHGLVEPTHPDLAVLRIALGIPSEETLQEVMELARKKEEERYQAYVKAQRQKKIREVEDELEAWCKLRCKLI